LRDRPAPLYEWLISFGSLPELAENRVFKDKPGGLVVDYIGIAAELKNALRTYTDAKGNGQPTVKAEDALKILKEKLDVVRGMIHGFDYWQFETKPLQLPAPAANHILGLNDGKKRFLDVMASVTKTYSLCGTLDEAAGLRNRDRLFLRNPRRACEARQCWKKDLRGRKELRAQADPRQRDLVRRREESNGRPRHHWASPAGTPSVRL
jgi:type I site-specific restriction-modification system R (restriction) subunit